MGKKMLKQLTDFIWSGINLIVGYAAYLLFATILTVIFVPPFILGVYWSYKMLMTFNLVPYIANI